MEKPRITIEVGLRDANGGNCSFEGVRHFPVVLDRMTQIRRQFEDKADLDLVPFERPMGAALKGGRYYPGLGLRSFGMCCERFNRDGYSFMAPLNGGLVTTAPYAPIDLESKIFDTDRAALSVLAENSSKFGVTNYVTVTRDDVRDFIRKKFPGLKIIASCAKFVGGHADVFKGKREYDDAFEGYDYVTPVNQHSTPEFLDRWRGHVKKIVLLLLTECNGELSRDCFEHYVRSQSVLFNGLYNRSKEFSGDFVKVTDPCFLAKTKCAGSLWGSLLTSRIVDLMRLVDFGVDRFKIPSGIGVDTLDPENIARLVMVFSTRSPRGEDNVIESARA